MQYQVFIFLLGFQFLGFSALFEGCATLPQMSKPNSQKEKQLQAEILGNKLAACFEPTLHFKDNSLILNYLSHLGQSLVDFNSELKGSRVIVKIVQNSLGKWKSYVLPGTRIYLPLGALKQLTYENEVAALVAIQLGHLVESQKEGSFSEKSEKSEAQEKRTFQVAVQILYEAGYDARGIISLLTLYLNHPDYSPYSMSLVSSLIDFSWHEVAVYAPLRNPITNSENFVQMRKRIEQL